MQTFITSADFMQNAKNLDSKRLNKQLLEGRQILSALMENKGWIHHPATKMWADNALYLVAYLDSIATECDYRGIKTEKNRNEINRLGSLYVHTCDPIVPRWWSDAESRERIILTHRASLFKKDPAFYAKFEPEAARVDKDRWSLVCCGPNRKPVCNYYWPTHEG